MRADNKNAISKIKKRSSIAEIRYKYSYIFRIGTNSDMAVFHLNQMAK